MLFRHFTPYWNPMSAHYTSSLIGRLPVIDASCGREKIHDCAWMSPPHLHRSEPPALHWFTREKEGSLLFEHTSYQGKTTSSIHCIRGLVGTRASLDVLEKITFLKPAGNRSLISSHPAHSLVTTDWAILAPLNNIHQKPMAKTLQYFSKIEAVISKECVAKT
jgi:hypothetical protein